MKKILLTIIALTIICTNISFAAEEVTPTPSEDLEKIQKLKEMVASRVAELKLVEKRGILGIVKQTSNSQITIEDTEKNLRVIDIDELTKFKGSADSFGISDIKQGDLMSFLGLYNKDTKRMIARYASSQKNLSVQFEGTVVEKDKKNYTLTVVNEKGEKKIIDVGTSTKTKDCKNEEMVKSGYSKINTEERVLVTGYYDLKDKNLIMADRIVHFLDIPPSPEMKKQMENIKINASDASEK